MHDEHPKSAIQAEVDTGLACLVMLARFHNVAASPEQIAHEYLDNGRQFAKAEMLLAGKQLGLKAKFVRSKVERLEHTPLPAIAASQDGRFFIIARLDDGKALIHDPLVQRPEVLSFEELQARWTGELMLITSQASLAGQLVKAGDLLVEVNAQITAPVDGTVQQLAIHTDGGVVTEAQPLMVIVPSDQPMEVEAMLENKDIGFVRPGQEVEIKVETFTFTKYGVVHGSVVSISNDAIEDEKRGLLYSTRIQLKENSIKVGGKQIPLSAGMAVRAEVKTDKRKVIDYFLSPLQQYASESLEER